MLTEIFQITVKSIILVIDPETVPITDQLNYHITVEPETSLDIETAAITICHKPVPNHHTHNYRSSTAKYQRQIKQVVATNKKLHIHQEQIIRKL